MSPDPTELASVQHSRCHEPVEGQWLGLTGVFVMFRTSGGSGAFIGSSFSQGGARLLARQSKSLSSSHGAMCPWKERMMNNLRQTEWAGVGGRVFVSFRSRVLFLGRGCFRVV